MELKFNKNTYHVPCGLSGYQIKELFIQLSGLSEQDVYYVENGKLVQNDRILRNGCIRIYPKVCGGKGGFGSMLRAIGAQIEKTTNREACRDLSGRRLRDINEEKRLKTWINQQVEREKEAKEKKKKKLEKLCEMPRHDFRDETYDKERSDLPEKVEDAVVQGMKAADCIQSGEKRKQKQKDAIKKKKQKLWVDAEFDDLSTTDSDLSEDDLETTDKVGELRSSVDFGQIASGSGS